MSIKINLKDVNLSNYEPLPVGTYDAKITGGEMRETSGNGKLPAGTPMINWEFTLQDADKLTGRKIWTNTVIHETTLFTLKQLLISTGQFTEDDMDGELDFEISDIIGSDVAIVVAQREYNGNVVNDIKKIKSIGSTTATSKSKSSLLP